MKLWSTKIFLFLSSLFAYVLYAQLHRYTGHFFRDFIVWLQYLTQDCTCGMSKPELEKLLGGRREGDASFCLSSLLLGE